MRRGFKRGPRHEAVPADLNQRGTPVGTLAGAAPPWMEAWADWCPSLLNLKRWTPQAVQSFAPKNVRVKLK